MLGRDLKCLCGAGPADVAPDLDLDKMFAGEFEMLGSRGSVFWHCEKGHRNATQVPCGITTLVGDLHGEANG